METMLVSLETLVFYSLAALNRVPQSHQVLLSRCSHAPKEPSFFRNCWILMWPVKEEVPRFLLSCCLCPLSTAVLPARLRPPSTAPPSLALTPAFPEPRTFLDQILGMVPCLRGQFAPLLRPVQVVGSSQGRGQIDHGLFCAAPGKPQEGGHASWGQGTFRAQSLQGFRG